MDASEASKRIDRIATTIVDSCVKVHRALGPGLMEPTYQTCLAYELGQRGLSVDLEVLLPVTYNDVAIDAGYRIDILVEDVVLIEKAVQALLPLHEAQLLTYLKLSDRRIGFLVNWNVPRIAQGIKRMANKFIE